MHDQNMVIVKSLISVAWADNHFDEKEREMVEALIAAFDATDEQAKELRAYAASKKTLDDIPIDELSVDDCRVLLQHAVLLTYVDGAQHEEEKKFIDALCKKIGFVESETRELLTYADHRAKRFLNLL